LFVGAARGAGPNTTVTLQEGLNGYVGTTDTQIASAFPTTNYGANGTFGMVQHTVAALIRFPIFVSQGGPVPDGASIASATLSVHKIWGPDAVFNARRLLKSWHEGQATWNSAASGANWETPGALGASDVAATADGQGSIGAETGWVNIDVTASVQAFASGAPNHGWRFGYVSGPNSQKDFVARNSTNSAQIALRPRLTITYSESGQNCASGPYNGSAAAVPGEIEAENFDCGGEGTGYHDLTPTNDGGSQYRPGEAVDIADVAGGGRTIRFFDTGEWMAYTLNVPAAGSYKVAISAAHNATPGTYRIEIDGVDVTGEVTVPGTGSWETYQWVEAPGSVSLTAGAHVLKLVSTLQSYRVDKLRVTVDPNGDCNAGSSRPFNGAPVGGSAIPVPAGGATIEAEHFNCGGEGSAFHDATPTNDAGSTYRAGTAVDIMDIAGGRTIRYFDTGEWMEYTVNVATAGQYRFGISAAHNATPGTYRIEVDGNDVTGNVTVSGTGSWDTYQWFDATNTVNLSAGQHVVRLVSVLQSYRVDKLRVMPAGGGGADDCSRPGLDLCVRFGSAPETQFEGLDFNVPCTAHGGSCGEVRTAGVNGAITSWAAHNKADGVQNGDRAADQTRIALTTEAGSRDAGQAIKFTTQDDDDCVHTSCSGAGDWERSEVMISDAVTGAAQGVEQWWAHSVYFPAGFQIASGDYRSSVFFQFHGKNTGGNPNFSLNVFNEPGTGRTIIRALSWATNDAQYAYTTNGGQHDVSGQCIDGNFQEGVWYDFIHRIVWSDTTSGSHEIWMRKGTGTPVKVMQRMNIRTLYDNDTSYLKFGTYHYPINPGVSSVIHDRIRRSSLSGNAGFEAVRMPDFQMPSGSPVNCNPSQ
jgi:hypothetical protein